MVRFGVIINPASRRMRRTGAIQRFKDVAKNYDVFFEETKFTENPTAELYKEPLKRLLEKKIDALLVCSGDGGHHLVDTALFEMLGEKNMIPQANLRGGTMNVRAESAKLPRKNFRHFRWTTAEYALKKFLLAYGRKDPKELKIENRTLIRIKTGDIEHLGFSYSSGFLVNFFDEYYSLGGAHVQALSLVARSALSFPQQNGLLDSYLTSTKGKVILNDEVLYENEYKWMLLTSQDINMHFGILELAPKQLQDVNDTPTLRFIGSQETTKWELVQQIPAIFNLKGVKRRNIKISDMTVVDVHKIEIIPEGKHRYLLDGDIYETENPLLLESAGPIPYLVLPPPLRKMIYKAIPKPFSKKRHF